MHLVVDCRVGGHGDRGPGDQGIHRGPGDVAARRDHHADHGEAESAAAALAVATLPLEGLELVIERGDLRLEGLMVHDQPLEPRLEFFEASEQSVHSGLNPSARIFSMIAALLAVAAFAAGVSWDSLSIRSRSAAVGLGLLIGLSNASSRVGT